MTDFPLLEEYRATWSRKAPGTIVGYTRALDAFFDWLGTTPGANGDFRPELFTKTAIETYFNLLTEQGYSSSYQVLVKAAISGFAEFLIHDKELIRRNPTYKVHIPADAQMAPRMLTPDQRYVLRSLVEREGSPRGAAIFALGYYSGCRVSDVSWLKLENVHLADRSGWLRVGYKGGKTRDIDITRYTREPLRDYLNWKERKEDDVYVFTGQRGRLTEPGIHHWFRQLKASAVKAEWDLVHDLSFHDLRHDFAHRARDAGWTLEELAFYLGHITARGGPAILSTARYTQAGREQIKDKLKLLGA